MAKAVYAGSFDPPTKGHEWMIEKGMDQLFKPLVVVVGVNPEKKSLFSVEERIQMLSSMLRGRSDVEVRSCENQFLVNYASSIGAKFILRGIRSNKDFEFEAGMIEVNRRIDNKIDTIFLIPPPAFAVISSSMVKGLIGPSGWKEVVKEYVPDAVYKELLRKFG